ncbi:MAG: GDSL-type esterase/lipase family protein [Candidatus Bathyarchaeota archaeon]|nr:GDSL-type esterase/lipase family protein [Candidatus Bathyarchaeota archaeon]
MHVKEGMEIVRVKFLAVFLAVVLVLVSSVVVLENLSNSSAEPIRVACVGDSITEYTNYPQTLQDLLGDRYFVENFGASGSTVLCHTYNPYMGTHEFYHAQKFQPNIVIIMLGTNDAREDIYQAINNFESDYQNLINQLQNLESNPQIYLVTPPPIFDNNLSLNNTNLTEGIIPLIEEIANQNCLITINVYNALTEYSQYFPDGVHPTDEAATIIANQIYQGIS